MYSRYHIRNFFRILGVCYWDCVGFVEGGDADNKVSCVLLGLSFVASCLSWSKRCRWVAFCLCRTFACIRCFWLVFLKLRRDIFDTDFSFWFTRFAFTTTIVILIRSKNSHSVYSHNSSKSSWSYRSCHLIIILPTDPR